MNSPRDASDPDSTLLSLGAIVLCGGQSSRLGIDKQELMFDGKTFLETIVLALQPVVRRILLVGNVNVDRHRLPDSVLIGQDQRLGKGPLEGIRVGLEALANDCEYAYVSSCDVPLLTGDLVEFLFARIGDADAIVPTKGPRQYGMTAIYRTCLHTAVDQRIQRNKLRVCNLAEGFQVTNIDAEELRVVDPELDTLTNINSAEDYFCLLKRFGQQCPEGLLQRLTR